MEIDPRSASGPGGSETLLPGDHLRMLIELMRPLGTDLGRRWLAALMLVPEAERSAVVSAVEAQIAREYGTGGSG